MNKSENRYAEFLQASGKIVVRIGDIFWYLYQGFVKPAYLPHVSPDISEANASEARTRLGGLFARWDTDFGNIQRSPWWFVVRSGSYCLDQVSGNTRSKIRRGQKRLEARPASITEIREQGLTVCEKAVRRYRNRKFMPAREEFDATLAAARHYSDTCEYYGVFRGKTLVGFAENHLQSNAVFWESIWYDPEALRDYSSYLLIHSMLEYYLNERALLYVSDGSRNLYHDSTIHTFLMEKFGFERCYAILNIKYSPVIYVLAKVLYPFRKLINLASKAYYSDFALRLHGLLLQEQIVRKCKRTTKTQR